ncbi:hypothetical protein SBOR_3756 [Sclerotinia borealis F-4128]|uniref:Uncharacterized protein n=1 Tax=Sclerotinia borealis (strain F-4128) TaxID=1432307 RepID=W9CGM3_SCLBF|nr:hypothetical protein SBOR_3756 [Sclerotinia borealis F-4128]
MASEPDKTVFEALMSNYKREKSLSTPSALTDEERRVFLDFPGVDMETANIRAVTALSREELIEKAVKDSSSLMQEETILLQDRFWTPGTEAEHSVIWQNLLETETIIMGEEGAAFSETRKPAYLPDERESFSIGSREVWGRPARAREMQASAMAEAALPDAPEWICRLYREGKKLWGFAVLYDGTMQGLNAETLDFFQCRWEARVENVFKYNSSKDIIDAKWWMIPFNAPGSAAVPYVSGAGTALDASDSGSQQDGVVLRSAFREILQNPLQYEQRADIAPITALGETREFDHYMDGLAASGILTNTFLVFDRICMTSVLESDYSIESMRIRAFEADYPVPGKIYAEGYQGYTWVRLDQLVYYFYELRLMKADKVGMDEIWQAAQQSLNTAFVSMDPEEAGNWTRSNPMAGFERDSILGKRKYAKK